MRQASAVQIERDPKAEEVILSMYANKTEIARLHADLAAEQTDNASLRGQIEALHGQLDISRKRLSEVEKERDDARKENVLLLGELETFEERAKAIRGKVHAHRSLETFGVKHDRARREGIAAVAEGLALDVEPTFDVPTKQEERNVS